MFCAAYQTLLVAWHTISPTAERRVSLLLGCLGPASVNLVLRILTLQRTYALTDERFIQLIIRMKRYQQRQKSQADD